MINFTMKYKNIMKLSTSLLFKNVIWFINDIIDHLHWLHSKIQNFSKTMQIKWNH